MSNRVPDFGDYVRIEHKRYGCDNQMMTYKVINNLVSNTYIDVPVDAANGNNKAKMHDGMVAVVSCIMAGVCEERVERFRIEDVQLQKDGSWACYE